MKRLIVVFMLMLFSVTSPATEICPTPSPVPQNPQPVNDKDSPKTLEIVAIITVIILAGRAVYCYFSGSCASEVPASTDDHPLDVTPDSLHKA